MRGWRKLARMQRHLDEARGPRSSRGAGALTHTARAAAMACWLIGCGGGGGGGTSGTDAAVDAAGPQWWQPKVGEAKNWDIQLTAPIDVTTPRTMYDLDLWALVPVPTMLDYGDGDPVTVPAGALAGAIAQLHARTPPTIVICHLETGALDLALPDARKFPGYRADMNYPNSPAAPAAGSVIGYRVGATAKRWLDIRAASRSKVIPVLFKRFELARSIGCDGVEADRNQVFLFDSGFTTVATDSYSWYGEIADQAHARKLSAGMKNGNSIAGQVDMMADKYDWMMVERCGELDDCDSVRPFINALKDVLAIDYDHDSDGVAQGSTLPCSREQLAMIADGIYKDVPLSKNVRTQCAP